MVKTFPEVAQWNTWTWKIVCSELLRVATKPGAKLGQQSAIHEGAEPYTN